MKTRTWVSVILVILFTTGCATSATTPMIPSTTVASTPQTVTIPPSTRRTTPITIPLSTPLSPTESPTISLTSNPPPTLSVKEAKTLILDLAQKHEDCQLPCLWGFTPGKSNIEAAITFVSQFGLGDSWIGDIQLSAHNYSGLGGVDIFYPKNDIFIIIHWSYYQSDESSKLELLTMSSSPMEKLGTDPINQQPIYSPVFGNPTFTQEMSEYLLPNILMDYGTPEQVWMAALPDDPNRPDIKWYPFSLVLLYLEKGIFVEYVSTRGTEGEYYLGCPSQAQIYIATWDAKNEITMENILRGGSVINKYNIDYFKPIYEATNMKLESFYETFINPEYTLCIETPKDIWLGP